ncbi:hypothetical protein FDP41_002570 [Naegleria fowleri]|uniref:Uncharacterized protein n=1 Tax=Naegleria fowleri TaxID=5763 RepID=A0A6A5BYV1_NAEFO|nr:uncharacterized protein FDP41_002570 [Naegleria fowleri]KAF0978750.1 hypothetical protein FDP41_002570 [Naegleria fowleri]CAG4717986.1 unnamed protein product [Naegleria fowleri]
MAPPLQEGMISSSSSDEEHHRDDGKRSNHSLPATATTTVSQNSTLSDHHVMANNNNTNNQHNNSSSMERNGTTSLSPLQIETIPNPTTNDSKSSTNQQNPPSSAVSSASSASFKSPKHSPTLPPTPTQIKPIETKEWQVDFRKFPIVDPKQIAEGSKKKLRKKVSKFYEKQNELVEGFAELYTNTVTKEFLRESDDEGCEGESFIKKGQQNISGNDSGDDATNGNNNTSINVGDEHITNKQDVDPSSSSSKETRYANFCIQASFWVNVLLVLLKVSASFLSLSLSVITSTIDSLLDLVSGLILFYTNRLKNKKSDLHLYPVGKERLEPLSFIIFATCMATASLQIIKEGFVSIITGLVTGDPYLPTNSENIVEWLSKPELLNGSMDWMLGVKIPALFKMIFYIYGLLVLIIAIVAKTILYFLCIRAKESPSCQAYAFDHRNDIMSNTFLVFSLFISQWVWWFDPFGATLLSIYIIYGWVEESLEHVTKLVGLTAESEFIKKITFIAVNHSEKIMKVETVTAWYSGMNIIAEVHVVLPPDMSLREAHNIGEDLQLKIESVPEVERCFVHLDFNDTHRINNKQLQ